MQSRSAIKSYTSACYYSNKVDDCTLDLEIKKIKINVFLQNSNRSEMVLEAWVFFKFTFNAAFYLNMLLPCRVYLKIVCTVHLTYSIRLFPELLTT